MTCVGIDFCTKKNCLEQEICIQQLEKNIQIKFYQNGKPQIKQVVKNKSPKKRKKDQLLGYSCQQKMIKCKKERVCEILGSCIYVHPKIIGNLMIIQKLHNATEVKTVAKILEEIMPSLKRLGVRRFHKRNKKM